MNIRRATIWLPIVIGSLGLLFTVIFTALAGLGVPVKFDTTSGTAISSSIIVYIAYIGLGLILKDAKESATIRKSLITLLAASLVAVFLPTIVYVLTGQGRVIVDLLQAALAGVIVMDMYNNGMFKKQ